PVFRGMFFAALLFVGNRIPFAEERLMRNFVLPAVLALTLAAVPAVQAQPARQALPLDANVVVTQWYRQFLEREPDPAGLPDWPHMVRRGDPPADVLAGILSSDEYFLRGGSTNEAFVGALFADLAGRVPTPREQREWADRVGVTSRKDVARELLQR